MTVKLVRFLSSRLAVQRINTQQTTDTTAEPDRRITALTLQKNQARNWTRFCLVVRKRVTRLVVGRKTI